MTNRLGETKLAIRDKVAIGLILTSLGLAAGACGGGQAERVVSGLAARPGAPIEPGLASAFTAGDDGIRAHFDGDAARETARVVFPRQSNGRVHLEDAISGAVVAFRLRGARSVDAETGDGYVVYRGAHDAGATMLHRALPSGTEDYVAFEERPAEPKITYDVMLGPSVAGLRLVAGTLEMLDADGAPRLRVEPPWVVGATGARVGATVAVEGCAVDTDPTAPWGRQVTPPGSDSCAVTVTWPDAEVRYPAVLDPRWTTTGSMTASRQEHTATLLSTGKVLVAGGRTGPTNSSGLTTAELFDRTTGTWAATGSMSGGRFQHTATQLATNSNTTTSGKVLVMGGITAGASLNTAELYSPSAGTWVAATVPNGARNLHTATLLSNGKVLVAGGSNGATVLATASLYDPSSGSGTWTATGTMPQKVRSHTATLLQVSGNATLNNKVLVVGGDSGGGATVANVQLFDGTSAWSSLTALSSAREAQTATALSNGNVLVTGGLNGTTVLNTTSLFNAASGSGSWASAGNMTTARQAHTATLLPSTIVKNGQVLVAGGSNGTASLATDELWNGSTTWTATSALPTARQTQTATLLSNNMVLLTGGNNGTTGLSTAALYDASFALACTSNSQCTTGFCTNGVCCDTACNSGCGACNLSGKVGTCSPVASGTTCRASAGVCDVAETCNGTALTCPADGFLTAGTTCRAASGVCDVAETCSGTSAACPANGFAAAGTVCRASAGACDAPETCSGTASTCPADALAVAGTVCRPALGACDVAETCSGSSATCPVDLLAAAGTTCAVASGNQGAETCSGASSVCHESGRAADVLGFETAGDWAASNTFGQIIGENPTHTEGIHSLEVAAHSAATFTSIPVSAIGSGGSLLLLDIMLPVETPPNPSWAGSADMFLSAPSLGINNDFAGSVVLSGLPHGQWETLAFAIPAADAGKLSAGGYADLTFTLSLGVPSGETGHFLLDNLRAAPADVVPSLYGIATDSSGATKAVFNYTTTAPSVQIPYGEGNALLDATGAFITAPREVPPQTFVSVTHAPFVATLTGSALTWRIGTHTATATSGSTQLPTVAAVDGTKDAVLPDGRKVNIDSTPPQQAVATADPPLGAPDTGVLAGNLQITPSGAAIYSLPIVMAPGVGGVAPNLSLYYSSQSGNGIAGQGWTFQGLSMIHKCPRTKQQDGIARPVAMDSDPTLTSGNTSDGVCLDGQRLFETGSGTYTLEKREYSTITYFPSDNHFEVKTKTNEIRYYGLTSNARVVGNGLNAQNQTTTATAIWALERVADGWGNFYYVHYNLDQADFALTGLRVTEIDYTGHMNASAIVDTAPFASVKFSYETRPDVRWMRFAQSKFPLNQRLKGITTDRGAYTLNYSMDAAGLVSELVSIHYCTGATCLKDLTFDWTSQPASWSQLAGYSLPSNIPTGHGLLGTQLIDLDGDGRTDLVYATQDSINSPLVTLAWLNTGTGWAANTQLALPAPLARGGVPTGARFADMDGDGVLDFLVDSPTVACGAGCAGPSVWLNRFATGQGWQAHAEFSTLPSTSSFATMQPIRFGSLTFCDGVTATPANGFCEGFQHMTLQPATLVDINGDGKMDIVRVEEGGAVPNLTAANLEVLVNQGPGASPTWVRYSEAILTDTTLNFNSEPTAKLPDLNRDGFSDLVREDYYYKTTNVANQPNQISVFQQIALNERDTAGVQQFAATVNRSNCTVTANGFCGGGPRLSFGPQIADLDADGLFDEVLFGPLNDVSSSTDLASGVGVAINDGRGPRLSYVGDAAGFVAELSALSPVSNASEGKVFPEDFAYAFADINGDGLPDLIRNHYNCPSGTTCQGGAVNVGGGQVLYNTGSTWGSGTDQWHRSAGPSPLPGVLPSVLTAGCGGTFVDLNGDGLVDFIQEEGNNASGSPACNGSAVGRGAWLNGAVPPVITGFPYGRATPKTAVSYVHITEPAAHAAGAVCDGVNANAVYCDDGVVNAGTKKVSAPLRVVAKVSRADGTGSGTLADTTYAYYSLRADPNGRGPLGFQRVISYDHASGVKTDTTYAQAFPYTGLPTEVVRSQVTQNNAPLSDTQTKYCDTTAVRSDGTLNCSAPGTIYPPQTSLFVYPYDVFDVAKIKQDASGNQVTTESSFTYDTLGNAKQVVVTTRTLVPSSGSPVATSTLAVTTTNQYGTSGSEEEKQGKVTDVVVTATGDVFLGQTTHHTTYSYSPANTFGGASSTARALAKKEIEPGAGWPVQEDQAYYYDPFGNVITTTTCANDFASCGPGMNSPSPFSVDHPPFRTTFVSFNTGDFDRPAGPGLISSLSYGNGRFPVKTFTNTINTAGGGTDHTEYSAYDPIKGVLLQKTGQDGLHTCTTYDDLGRPTSEVVRCGSSAPIAKTTAYFAPAVGASGTPVRAKLLTVTRTAAGAASWTFTDDQDKAIESLSRSFAGGFVEVLTTYDVLGRVATQSKPLLIQNFADTPSPYYQTITLYDGFNRMSQVTEDLGEIGGSLTTKQLVTTTTYNGLSLTTTRTVTGSPETRTETKNALGKLQSVVDTLGNEVDYLYDPDGNLLATRTPTQLLVATFYDQRGRKGQMTDADLGTWNYVFDGFGDLVGQTDANNQQFAMTYDQLGRILTKQDLTTAATAQWIYDTAGGAAIGKLAAMVGEPDASLNGSCALPPGAAVTGGNRAVKTYLYTGFSNIQAVSECTDGAVFQTSYEYDAIGRQSVIHYPTVNAKQLTVGYHYTGLGYLQYLSDESADYGVLWQAKALDAFGDVTDQQARNGVETVETRSHANGWLVGSVGTAHADGNKVIQSWTYTFDEVGNLISRFRDDQVADAIAAESFSYDPLNRVTGAFVTVGTPTTVKASSSYGYDGNGNLTQKDDKTYTYGVCPGPGRSGSGLHQVCSINGGATFVYDAAGNLTHNGTRTITYNAHNKAAQITDTTGTVKFMYGADQNRVVQVATSGGTTSRTVYVGLAGTGKSLYERTTTGTTVVHTNFIYAGGAHQGNAFAIRVMASDGSTTSTRYLSFDHLGSTTAVSDEKGHIATSTGPDTELLGYDPWGARRNPDGQPALPTATFASSVGHRDFTGQETVPSIGLINMNGRMYDPVLARFLSPDPDLQAPSDLQNYNRYSYVLNNPLRYTDPSGYDFWSSLGDFFSNPGNVILFAGETIFSVVACVAAPGVGCLIAGAEIALFNADIAVTQGASFEQTSLNLAIGLGASFLASGAVSALGGSHASSIWSIVAGSASAAVSTAVADVIGGKSIGWDVFWSSALSAGQGALTFGAQKVAALIQAEPVKLSLHLFFTDPSGNAIPDEEAAQLTKDAEEAWSGLNGKYYVTADFHDPSARLVVVIVYPGAGVSNTNAVGGSVIQLFAGGYQKPGGPVPQPETLEELGHDLGHEAGHALGAADQYNYSTGAAFAGHESDLMGSVDLSTRPFESTITEILKFNGGP